MRAQPGGQRMEQVMWAASGSEAVQKAIWAALTQDPSRNMILATRGGFHGKKGLAGAVTGCETDSERDPRVRFISFPMEECINLERRRQPLDLTPYREELERVRQELGDRLCCLVTEPYLGGGGSFHPQPEYLQLLQQFCREHDLLFILDEVQSNFGRTGPMYAYSCYGIEPDIVCLGKGLGNGVPVSAAVGPVEVFQAMGLRLRFGYLERECALFRCRAGNARPVRNRGRAGKCSGACPGPGEGTAKTGDHRSHRARAGRGLRVGNPVCGHWWTAPLLKWPTLAWKPATGATRRAAPSIYWDRSPVKFYGSARP